MFCPRCSQQQPPGEVRFCSRCGLQLAAVSQLLNNNGIPYMQPEVRRPRGPWIKRKELRTGVKFLLGSFFLFIPCLILAGIFDTGLPLLLVPITFLLGLAQVTYYFFFGESILPLKKPDQPYELSENVNTYNFQPSYDMPYSYTDSNRFNTNEFVTYERGGRRTSSLFDGR